MKKFIYRVFALWYLIAVNDHFLVDGDCELDHYQIDEIYDNYVTRVEIGSNLSTVLDSIYENRICSYWNAITSWHRSLGNSPWQGNSTGYVHRRLSSRSDHHAKWIKSKIDILRAEMKTFSSRAGVLEKSILLRMCRLTSEDKTHSDFIADTKLTQMNEELEHCLTQIESLSNKIKAYGVHY